MGDELTLLVGLPAAILVAVALPFIARRAFDRVEFGLYIVLATYFMEIVYTEFTGFFVGIYLYPGDVIFSFMAAVAIARLLFARNVPDRNWAWLAFGAVIFLSFALGMSKFGRAAGTDFRTYFYLWACALYFLSFPLEIANKRSILKAWFVCTGFLLVLTVFRWIAEYFGLPIADSWRGTGAAAEIRVIPSHATLFLANSMVILLYFVTARIVKGWGWLAVFTLLAVVLFLQHRSVWIATVLGVVALFAAFPGKVRSKLAQSALLGTVLVGVPALAVIGYGKLDSLLYSVQKSAVTALDDRGTAGGRIYGWNQLLQRMEPGDYVIGQPFGSGYDRYEFAGVRWKATWDPHNFYVQTLIRAGVVGLLLLLAVYFVTMKRLLASREEPRPWDLPPRILFVLLVMQLAYMMAYRFSYDQAIWLGIGISMAATVRETVAAKWREAKAEARERMQRQSTPVRRIDPREPGGAVNR